MIRFRYIIVNTMHKSDNNDDDDDDDNNKVTTVIKLIIEMLTAPELAS